METRKIVLHETGIILVGQVICVAVMLGVYALIGKFSQAVVLGGIAGAVLAVVNFLIMAIATSKAADKAAGQDVKGGKSLLQMSYMGRLVGLFVVLILCAKSGWFDLIALVLPLAFTRPIITVAEFVRKKGEKTA